MTETLPASSILYMGPIRGITDHIYRNTFASHFSGFDLAVAPFITSTKGNRIKNKYIKGLLPENNQKMPVIPQILSKSAEEFSVMANHFFDLGYDTVNWNLGCPYPQVANKHRGSGLLPYTDRIHTILDKLMPTLKGGLSVKTRLGWKGNEDIFRLIDVLNQYPVKEIIIHPRTGVQRYEGTPDLEAFSDCIPLIKHPVVYNGDIKSFEIFTELSARFNTIDRWMIGRWSVNNPFLPQQIKTGQNGVANKINKVKAFHDELFEQYCDILNGPSHILDRMKGLWRYFEMPFKDPRKSMKKLKKTKSLDQYQIIVKDFFEDEAHWIGL